jgi:hypothetical protein
MRAARGCPGKLQAEETVTLEDDLLWYVVWRSADYGVPTTKTRLVKYLYLVDLRTSREMRRRATTLQWIYYDFGPYAQSFEDLLKREVGHQHIRLERLVARPEDGREPVLVLPVATPSADSLSASLRRTADEVCSEWAKWDLNMLLNFVYFDTPPMRAAERGSALDLLADLDEAWPSRHRPLPAPTISPAARERLADLRRSHNRAMPRRSRVPAPVWDEQYLSLVRATGESDEWLLGVQGLLHSPDESPT